MRRGRVIRWRRRAVAVAGVAVVAAGVAAVPSTRHVAPEKPATAGPVRAGPRVGSDRFGVIPGQGLVGAGVPGPVGRLPGGPGGRCRGSSCEEVTSVSRVGTGMWLWTGGVSAIAMGSAAPSVVRIAVTSPDGKTTQVHPVAVGAARFFAFPFGQGPKHWKWTAYDGSGHAIISGEVVQEP